MSFLKPFPVGAVVRCAAFRLASARSCQPLRRAVSPAWAVSGRRSMASAGGNAASDPRLSLMDASCLSETQRQVREAVFRVCADFPDEYWAERDDTGTYPRDFHKAIADAGYIGIALPEELGGVGLGLSEAVAMLQTIAESGAGFAGAQSIHANVYATQPLSRFGTPAQRAAWLPKIISGEWRTCFGVTEPDAGLDTRKLRTRAERIERPDGGFAYRITGQKIWISSAQVADRMVLLARTGPGDADTVDGALTLLCIPLDTTKPGLSLQPIPKMGGRAVDANEVFFDNYEVEDGAGALVGAEGQGFRIVLHGLNAERCLIGGEALGLGYAALRRAVAYVGERVVFGKPVGAYQGVAHPLAEAWMALEAAKLVVYSAAAQYDAYTAQGEGKLPAHLGVACNMAKYLAAEAAFQACERSVLAMGGMGYARAFHVERYLRESLVPRLAPVSREMIRNFVAEKALGLPKSY
ncbi:acyl-CoA dehydrogenase [Sporothrix schenckii 1099-18]|uniref:Acyl-CoA dehydrogenase n=1 Tax=Sporothrix schenckii 1099-18 TaxID=1397361 RepID=A0A0F2MDY6_SPOSC|nr:acyl-CoA dehydrogenase [Sporothrix schenckii 1099-18]KJR87304.1 acyl-CoA dehydrogenase [Sporothrix schenckii 1099-18]